jgi:hypothetical protein
MGTGTGGTEAEESKPVDGVEFGASRQGMADPSKKDRYLLLCGGGSGSGHWLEG